NGTTTYNIMYARLLDEVDLNRPVFKDNKGVAGELDLDLFRDENGNYRFDKLFEGKNHPPIPEWFDESWRNVLDLDIKYREWFGAGVVQNILFKNPGEKPNATAVEQGAKYLGVSGNFSTVGDAVRAAGAKKDEYEEILEQNESISIQEAAEELNR